MRLPPPSGTMRANSYGAHAAAPRCVLRPDGKTRLLRFCVTQQVDSERRRRARSRDSKPQVNALLRRRRLLTKSPALMSSTSESATCAMTSNPRKLKRRSPSPTRGCHPSWRRRGMFSRPERGRKSEGRFRSERDNNSGSRGRSWSSGPRAAAAGSPPATSYFVSASIAHHASSNHSRRRSREQHALVITCLMRRARLAPSASRC